MQTNGSPLAVLQGNQLYYGPYPNNIAIATIEGEWIYFGPFASGGCDYHLQGNLVYSRTGTSIIFTIHGNTICDGYGSNPFLYCPTGNPMALAAAACCFTGDLRLRIDCSNVVDRNMHGILSPNSTEKRSGYASNGNIPDRLDGKRPPSNRFPDREWSANASENINQMKTPVSIHDRSQANTPSMGNNSECESYTEERLLSAEAEAWMLGAPLDCPEDTPWDIEMRKQSKEIRAKDKKRKDHFESTDFYKKNRKIVDDLVAKKLKDDTEFYGILCKVLQFVCMFSFIACPIVISKYDICGVDFVFFVFVWMVGLGLVGLCIVGCAMSQCVDEKYKLKMEEKYEIDYDPYFKNRLQ
jgi:hypothetical protein